MAHAPKPRARFRIGSRAALSAAVCGVLLLTALTLCHRADATETDVEVAQRFVVALNQGKVGEMVAMSACPFVFRNQEWESAKDGSGFVRGKADDKTFAKKKELSEFLAKLVEKAKIESETAANSPPPKEDLLKDNLKGSPTSWRRLNLFVFFRGMGDVEHVAIVGVDPNRHRVRGLYLN